VTDAEADDDNTDDADASSDQVSQSDATNFFDVLHFRKEDENGDLPE